MSSLNHLKQSPFCCSSGNMCTQSTRVFSSLSLFLVIHPRTLHLSQSPPSLTIHSYSTSSSPSSLRQLDKLLSGPEIWHIMPLCWSVFSVKPWIWERCKWYDYSLKGTINFTIAKPPQVQRLTSWDNEVNSEVQPKSAQWRSSQMKTP